MIIRLDSTFEGKTSSVFPFRDCVESLSQHDCMISFTLCQPTWNGKLCTVQYIMDPMLEITATRIYAWINDRIVLWIVYSTRDTFYRFNNSSLRFHFVIVFFCVSQCFSDIWFVYCFIFQESHSNVEVLNFITFS